LVLYLLGISVNLQSLFQRGYLALFKRQDGDGADAMRVDVGRSI
jgi:hypothetical protein